MSEVDWTRVFLDAVGRGEIELPATAACAAPRQATLACPSWQDVVFEKINELPRRVAEEVIDAITLTARDYRAAYRLTDEGPLVCAVPHWYALRLIERYGSLAAASATIFDPNRVVIRDYDDVYGAQVVSQRLQRRRQNHWDPWQHEG